MANLRINRAMWATGERVGSGIRGRVLDVKDRPEATVLTDLWQFYTADGEIDPSHNAMLETLLLLLDEPSQQMRLDNEGTLLLYGREYDPNGNRAAREAAEDAGAKRHPWQDKRPKSRAGEPLTDHYAQASLWLLGFLFQVAGPIEGLEIEHDLWTLCSTDKGPEERMTAALRLAAGPFRNPIDKRRRRAHEAAINRELGRRAEALGTWWKPVLIEATCKALVEAGWQVEFCQNTDDLVRGLRRELNRLVTLDLLGEDYAREQYFDFVEETDENVVEDLEITKLEIEQYLARALDGANLSDRDTELWLAVRWHGQSIAEAAEALGLERGAADVALHRVKKKVQKVLATL